MPTKKPKRKPVAKKRKRKTRPTTLPLVSGPKASRRFGLAMNLNFGPPGESCHWNCVYCPWKNHAPGSRTKKVKPPVAIESLLEQLRAALPAKARLDTLVLGGNSEPTLNPDFSDLVEEILKLRTELKGEWKIMCITNGENLSDPDIQKACNQLDAVWLKFDCAEDGLFKRAVNSTGSTKLDQAIDAAKKIPGLCVQTTLWKYLGQTQYQNWSSENLKALLEIYGDLEPKTVHLTTIRRKSRDSKIQPVTHEEMEAFAMQISEAGYSVETFE